MRVPARGRAGHKLFLTYLALIAATVIALTVGVGLTLRRHLTDMVADDLRRELYLAVALQSESDGVPPPVLASRLGELSGRRVTLVGPDGRVVGDSEVPPDELPGLENHASRPEVKAALAGRVGRAEHLSGTLGAERLYIAAPGSGGQVVRLSVTLDDVDATVGRVQRGILGGGLVVLVFGGLLSFAMSVAVTRPLRHVAAVARDLGRGNLSRRVHARHRDELGELGLVLDTLAEELQRRMGQLEGERAEMHALIDAMAEGVLALGPDGRVRRANRAARRIFGLGTESDGLSPPEVARRPAFLKVVQRARAGDPVPATEISHDGRNLLATAQPLPGGGAVLVFLDVSELRRLEDVRRDFVANASHELKTPLTAIRGYSETLLDENLPPALRRRFAEVVKENADRLQRIVDDLLDLSRIESGGWRAEPEEVAVADAAEDAWAVLAEAAAEKGVELRTRVAPGCEFVLADPSALRQILTNLLHNALRHTPAGGAITVSARPAPPGGGSPPGRWLRVEVTDTGSGIPAVHIPRIFERFYRVDNARARADGGTGLGLAIVRHLVESHGGTVEAESELGRGTTIRFTIPADGAPHRYGAVTI